MFTIANNNVIVSPETLLIREFKVLWDKDKSNGKEQVLKQFAYIYFTVDFKSPYKKSFTGDELDAKVILDIFVDIKWKPSSDIIAAREKYKELKTTSSMKLLDAANKAIKQITEYFNTFDLATIPLDKQHLAVKNTISNIQELDDLTLKLQSTKTRIERELEAVKMSGKRELRKRELPPSKRK